MHDQLQKWQPAMEFKNANRNRNVGIPLFNDSNVSIRGNLAEVLKSGIKKRNSCVRFQKPITCVDAQRVAIIEQRNANVTITICVFKFHRGPIKQNNHLHSGHRTTTCITLRTSSESNTRTLSFHMLYAPLPKPPKKTVTRRQVQWGQHWAPQRRRDHRIVGLSIELTSGQGQFC